jgi:undecaprenyl-diphosphatase
MDLIQAAILALVEGVTEFIPVSSTGHLIIASDWLRLSDERTKTFEIFIQLGAILAVLWLYRKTVVRVIVGLPQGGGNRRLVEHLAVAFLPAASVGFLTHRWIKAHLFHPLTVAGALVVGGLIILIIEHWRPRVTVERVEDMSFANALGVGLAQVLALFPGVSRSGATIMGGYGLGLSRMAATEFSFFLAIPTMFAATLFDLYKSRGFLSAADVPVFAVGFIVAFLSAVFVVKGFLSYVSRSSFSAFAWYRIAFGALLLAVYWPARL